MRVALVTVVLLVTATAVAAAESRVPLLSTNGLSVFTACGSADRIHRRTADGAILEVSLSRAGCDVQAASIELLGAPSGAWLYLGTTDIYQVGRLSLTCRKGVVRSRLRLDLGTATAYVSLESTASRRQKVLQPGQLLQGPPIALEPAPDQRVEWTVSPGGEAGWTEAHIVEVARPRCRADVRVLLTAFRNG